MINNDNVKQNDKCPHVQKLLALISEWVCAVKLPQCRSSSLDKGCSEGSVRISDHVS